jgi:hypothetical protein
MQKMLDALKAGESQSDPLTVYIGDSNTDMECLMSVDVGIVISQDKESKLMKTFDRLRIPIHHLRNYHPRQDNVKSVWWAKDFEEILNSRLLKGPK